MITHNEVVFLNKFGIMSRLLCCLGNEEKTLEAYAYLVSRLSGICQVDDTIKYTKKSLWYAYADKETKDKIKDLFNHYSLEY